MSKENVESLKRWWRAFDESGMPPPDLFDPAAEIVNFKEAPMRGPFHGHEGLRTWAEQIFEVVSDQRIDVEDVIDAGEVVVSVQRIIGTARHTGLPFDFRWWNVFWFKNGLVIRAEGFLDRTEALEAAGLSE